MTMSSDNEDDRTMDAALADAKFPERIGPFAIHGLLGRGGTSVVFDGEAHDGTPVAVKVLRPDVAGSRGSRVVQRFTREAAILERLRHPNIVRLLAFGRDGDVLYLGMQRVHGASLAAVRRRGSLGFDTLVALGRRIANALAHMHDAGVVHRDIKPSNILIDTSGQPVITDFGLGAHEDAEGITKKSDVLGSPGFIAPEVVNGETPTPLSDQYALGRVLFELGATGRPPTIPRELPVYEAVERAMVIDWPRFPSDARWPELARTLARMLAKDPRERFTNAHAVERALEAYESMKDEEEKATDDLIPDLERPAGERSRKNAESPTRASEERRALESASQIDGGRAFDPAGDGVRTEIAARPIEPSTKGRDAAPVPLDEIVRRREAEPPTRTPPTLDIPLQDEPKRPRSDAPERVPPIPPGTRGVRANAETDLQRLQTELRLARDEVDLRKRTRVRDGVLACAMGMFVGAAIVLAVARSRPPPISLLVSPPMVNAAAYDPSATTASATNPTEDRVREARGLLELATEHLARRDLSSAEKTLRSCVEIAGLPECHRVLATILALANDPSARAEFRRYLEVAPKGLDADTIRDGLDPAKR